MVLAREELQLPRARLSSSLFSAESGEARLVQGRLVIDKAALCLQRAPIHSCL